MKKPRPTTLEKIQAKQAAPAAPHAPAALAINPADVSNCLVALRRGGLLALPGPDMAAVAASMDRLEAQLAQFVAAQHGTAAPAAPAAPTTASPAATAEPAKA